MNKRVSRQALQAAAAVTALSAALSAVAAPTVNLTNVGYVTYGDARSYSLPIAGLEVMSGPGQIDVFTKLGLGANGQLGNAPLAMDDAFDTPQANPIEGFRTATQTDPSGTGAWDRDGWWDSSLSALNGALNLQSNSMVFFFANNEIGDKVRPSDADVLAEGPRANLAAWMRVEISRISTNTVLGRFDLTNDPDQNGISTFGGLPTFAGPGMPGYGGGGVILGDVGNYTSTGGAPKLADFVMSGGEVCLQQQNFIDPLTNQPAELIVSCAGPYTRKVQHNLGGDRAAYAVVLPELDKMISDLIKTPNINLDDFAIHVDYRLGCGSESGFDTVRATSTNPNKAGDCFDQYALNGGDEKLFLGTQAVTPDNPVPEPGAIALTAAALAAMGWARRRRA